MNKFHISWSKKQLVYFLTVGGKPQASSSRLGVTVTEDRTETRFTDPCMGLEAALFGRAIVEKTALQTVRFKLQLEDLGDAVSKR
ncbi:hypothetical protein GT50_08605 [Geobacillus stearothermophilus 10]|nr:hypothetical protein GT50_08605 [Geobacillus stearothermophilus 10]